MNTSPRSTLFCIGLAALLLAAAVPGLLAQAETEPPLIEVQGRFFHVTSSQREAAFAVAGVDRAATVLTTEQFRALIAALTKTGISSFDESRIITQSGSAASAIAVDELRYPTKYELSKRNPDKLVAIEFAMRLVGVTLDALPTVGPTGRIALEAKPMFNKFLGFVEDTGQGIATSAPELTEQLKAPLRAGTRWTPVFSEYSEKRIFDLENGQTAVMFGRPSHDIGPPDHEIFVTLTVRTISRDQEP